MDITDKCNNDCIACWCKSPLLFKNINKKEYSIPFSVIKDIIDDAYKMNVREFYLAGGGDPFMHPDIMKILEHIKSRDMVCVINTNFTLVDKDKVRRLIELDINHLTVSIWAGTAETYSITHPNKSEEMFYQLKENLKLLNKNKKKHPYIKIYNVISNLNYFEIEKMVDLAIETGSESVEFTVVDTMPGQTDSLLLTKEQCNEVIERCKRVKKKLKRINSPLILFKIDQFLRRVSNEHTVSGNYDQNIVEKMPCYIGWSFLRIMPDGNVNSCLKAHRIPIGNVHDNSIIDIWTNNKQKFFRKKTLVYKKTDKFFKMIGNDPNAKCGCYRGCDDLGRNEFIHERINSLGPIKKIIFKGYGKYLKFFGKDMYDN